MNGPVELPDNLGLEILAAAERLRLQSEWEMERLHRISGGDYRVTSECSLFIQSGKRNSVELVAPYLPEIEAAVARYKSEAARSGLTNSPVAPPPPPVAPMQSAPLVSGPGSSPRQRTLIGGSLRPPSSLPPRVGPADYVDTYGDVGDWPGVEAAVDEAITDLETPFVPPAPVDESEVRR